MQRSLVALLLLIAMVAFDAAPAVEALIGDDCGCADCDDPCEDGEGACSDSCPACLAMAPTAMVAPSAAVSVPYDEHVIDPMFVAIVRVPDSPDATGVFRPPRLLG